MTDGVATPAASNEVFCPYAKDILASKHFHPYQMAAQYQQLQQKSGIDFSFCVRILSMLPLFLDGAEHKQVRKRMALRMQERKPEQEAAVVAKIDELLQRHFSQSGQIDLVEDFANPLWRALSRSIVQRDDDLLDVIDAVPTLFFPSLSLNKRKHINAGIGACIDKYGDAVIEDMALASLGVKPFVGTLALSFYDAVENNPGQKLGSYTLAKHFSKSSLNYADRIAKKDIGIGDKHFVKGQRVSCVTQSPQYSEADNVARLYGSGSHLCLGKPIAQFALAYLNERCQDYPCVIEPLATQMLSDQEPFAMPKHLHVAIRV